MKHIKGENLGQLHKLHHQLMMLDCLPRKGCKNQVTLLD